MVVTLTGVAIPAYKGTGQPESCPASATIILCGSAPLNMGMLTYDNKKRRLARLLSPCTFAGLLRPCRPFSSARANVTTYKGVCNHFHCVSYDNNIVILSYNRTVIQ